jgi:Putative auto-transporter adhesin, head GIN domain
MKLPLALFLVVLLFLPSLACGSFTTNSVIGSGEIVTQTIDVSGFQRVTLQGFGDVFIEQGQTQSLSVQTDENILPLLDIHVRGSELILGTKNGVAVNPSKGITYMLTVQDLDDITLAGSGTFHVGSLKASNFGVSVSGSGDVEISSLAADKLSIELNGSGNILIENVDVKTIDTSVQGSGDIKIEGQANTQKVRVGGSGNYLAGDLETNAADINVPGSADVTVWVEDELSITVSGSGDIRYYGNPAIDQTISGSGEITSLGAK